MYFICLDDGGKRKKEKRIMLRRWVKEIERCVCVSVCMRERTIVRRMQTLKLENDVPIHHLIGNYTSNTLHIYTKCAFLEQKDPNKEYEMLRRLRFASIFRITNRFAFSFRIKFVAIFRVYNIKMHLCCKFLVYYAMCIRFCLLVVFFLLLLPISCFCSSNQI